MADLTITVPDEQIPRLQEAFAFAYNLGSPSTQVDIEFVKTYVIADLKQFVKNAEQRLTASAAIEGIGSPSEIKLQSA